MKNQHLLSIVLFAILIGGCATKSPYDVSAAEVQKRRGALPPLKPGFAPPAGMTEKHFKKGDTLPDGTIAQEDVMVANDVKHFKKGDVLPDGKIADGNRQMDMVIMRRTKPK